MAIRRWLFQAEAPEDEQAARILAGVAYLADVGSLPVGFRLPAPVHAADGKHTLAFPELDPSIQRD